MTDIEQAKSLINQGKNMEAQSILSRLIYSNPHNIPAWFLYVKTLDSSVKRMHVLEICLRLNRGDPEVTKAVEVLNEKLNKLPPAKAIKAVNAVYGWKVPFSDLDAIERSKRPIPDIHIPVNEGVLSYLKNSSPYREAIVHFDRALLNNTQEPAISDSIQYFLLQAEKLPQQCEYLIYGCPAIVHPESGIIFGFQKGPEIFYRLPPVTVEAIGKHFEMVFAEAAGIKPGSNLGNSEFRAFDKHWINHGSYLTPSLLQKCYDFNGSLHNKSIDLNIKEDLKKLFPTRSEKIMNRLLRSIDSRFGHRCGDGSVLHLYPRKISINHDRSMQAESIFKGQIESRLQRAVDVWDFAAFSNIFLASGFSCSQAESMPAPAPVPQTVNANR